MKDGSYNSSERAARNNKDNNNTARILRGVLETWGSLLSLRHQWKSITYAGVKNFQTSKIIIKKKSSNKKKNYHTADFAVLANHRVKLKGREKRNQYPDLSRELKKNYRTWKWWCTRKNHQRRLIQGLDDLEISGRVETIQTTALLRSARILRRVQ